MSQQPTETDAGTDPDTTEANRRDRPNRDAMRWLSAIAALVGLWIVASPFMYEATEMATWNNIIVGAAIFLLAGYNFYRMTDANRVNTGSSGLVVLLGLWMILAPFLFEFGSEALLWSSVVSGAIVAVLEGYNAYRGRTMDTRTTTGART